MKLSVIIATHNRCQILSRTLRALVAQDFPAEDYEVVVVVDGSSDGTSELLRSLKPSCSLRVVEQPNRGQAAARNAGLEVARGDLVLFIDDDILCSRKLVGEHVAAHEVSGGAGFVVFGQIVVSRESPETLATHWMRECTLEYADRIQQQAEPRWPDDAIVFANSSARRSLLLASGGFDERFFRAHEDTDLGLRLWKLGVRFKYKPTTDTYQLYTKSDRDLVRNDAYWYGKNEVLLCRKHPEYRPYSKLARLRYGFSSKSLLREAAARMPVSPEPLLRPPFWMAERLRSFAPSRRLAIRLLQIRMSVVFFRSAVQETGSWQALRREFGLRLPVLLYHHVGPRQPGPYPELTVLPEQFERHMRWLARRGYVGIRPSDWLRWCREGKALPPRPVLITLDDGYADTAEYALPVLRRYGFSATVYVVTGQIGGTNAWDEAQGSGTHRLMSAEQIRYWAANGIEFGAHSRTHPDLTALTGPKLEEEVIGSRDDLERLLGTRPTSFAYPYGSYNESVRQHVSGAFDLAFSCDEGINGLATDPCLLKRAMVLPSDSLADLACRVHLGWSLVERARARLRLRSRLRSALGRVQELTGTITSAVQP